MINMSTQANWNAPPPPQCPSNTVTLAVERASTDGDFRENGDTFATARIAMPKQCPRKAGTSINPAVGFIISLLLLFTTSILLYLWHTGFRYRPSTAGSSGPIIPLGDVCHATLKEFVISPTPPPPICKVNYSNYTLSPEFAAAFGNAFFGGTNVRVGAFGT